MGSFSSSLNWLVHLLVFATSFSQCLTIIGNSYYELLPLLSSLSFEKVVYSTFIPPHWNHRTQRWTIPCKIFCTTVFFIPHGCLTSFCFRFMLIFILTTHNPVFSISYSHSRVFFFDLQLVTTYMSKVTRSAHHSSDDTWGRFVPCHALGSMNNHNAYLYEWSTSSMHQIFWSFINAPNFLMHIITHP